jgi:hypothetical protein
MKIKKDIAVSDSGFVFNPSTGESFSVNPIGMEIISLIKEGKSLEDIGDHFVQNYHVELPIVEKDLQDFLEMLEFYSLKEQT